MTDRRSRLDPFLFEQLQCLHYHWEMDVIDWARDNSELIEEIDVQEFEYMEAHEELIAALEDA